MKREEITRRIENEKKFREQGLSNKEIAELMGVSVATVYGDIGKEPDGAVANRNKRVRDTKLAGVTGNAPVHFPGSYKRNAPEAPAEEPATPFAEAWQRAVDMKESLQSLSKPHSSAMDAKTNRKPQIIVAPLYEAINGWNKVLEGSVMLKQPKVEDEKLFFDNANQPWLVIVYSEVAV